MKNTAISRWIQENFENPDFENAIFRLLSFACAEWFRRENGVKMEAGAALSFILGVEDELVPIGRWIENPRAHAEEIGEFCEKTKSEPLPDSLKCDFPSLLDLRGVKCPYNSVQSRLFLAGAPGGREYRIYLDDGAPIENVPGSLVVDGYELGEREKKENFWILKVVKKADK